MTLLILGVLILIPRAVVRGVNDKRIVTKALLIQYVQQKGCSRTGHAIATTHQDPTLTKRFVTNAEHQRGILCSVEYPVDQPTVLERGQKVFLRFPMGSCY